MLDKHMLNMLSSENKDIIIIIIIIIALTAASTFSCRIERGFSPGICWQLSAVGSPLVP